MSYDEKFLELSLILALSYGKKFLIYLKSGKKACLKGKSFQPYSQSDP